jgi:hypothetical protein
MQIDFNSLIKDKEMMALVSETLKLSKWEEETLELDRE